MHTYLVGGVLVDPVGVDNFVFLLKVERLAVCLGLVGVHSSLLFVEIFPVI